MLDFTKNGENYQIVFTENYLTVCDPCCPNDGYEIQLALGKWDVCPFHEATCFGGRLYGWRLANSAAKAEGQTRTHTCYIDTDTGLIALVEDSFKWDERKDEIVHFKEDAGAGADWLALCTGGDGLYRVTAKFNQNGEAVVLNLI